MASRKEAELYHNQLKFNLAAPSSTMLAARFHRPEPIVIEKLGGRLDSTAQSQRQQQSAFKFSAISEEKLTMAIQLAKRDLKKKKLQEKLNHEENAAMAEREVEGLLQGRGGGLGKENVSGKRTRSARGKSPALRLKEQEKNRKPRSSRTQTGGSTRYRVFGVSPGKPAGLHMPGNSELLS